MELDAKQKVLLAIYLEYQKDIPNMNDNINFRTLGLDYDVFKVAVDKLDNEGLINSAKISRHHDNGSIPYSVSLFNVKPSLSGIEYVETKLEINKTLNNEEKVEKVKQSVMRLGWEEIKDIVAKTFAEIVKS